jgi:hypothetical protein
LFIIIEKSSPLRLIEVTNNEDSSSNGEREFVEEAVNEGLPEQPTGLPGRGGLPN